METWKILFMLNNSSKLTLIKYTNKVTYYFRPIQLTFKKKINMVHGRSIQKLKSHTKEKAAKSAEVLQLS
jgi:hypothetical protein